MTGAITSVNKELSALPATLDDHLMTRMRQVAQEIIDEVNRRVYVNSLVIFCCTESVTGMLDLIVRKKMHIGDSSMHTRNPADIYFYMHTPRLGGQCDIPKVYEANGKWLSRCYIAFSLQLSHR